MTDAQSSWLSLSSTLEDIYELWERRLEGVGARRKNFRLPTCRRVNWSPGWLPGERGEPRGTVGNRGEPWTGLDGQGGRRVTSGDEEEAEEKEEGSEQGRKDEA
eukprot:TRINITY_DN26581_c0_g1_i1.p4 TRINITY_DN26581_c0_g1~~TRINITY_DN26581_c0_g1_i1.p4  ORF type:complete len:104 (+),score=13.86 TRINITY_DN26581_c0_g1_i1:974-1285(+)